MINIYQSENPKFQKQKKFSRSFAVKNFVFKVSCGIKAVYMIWDKEISNLEKFLPYLAQQQQAKNNKYMNKQNQTVRI